MLLQTRSANDIIRYKQRIQAKKPGKMVFFPLCQYKRDQPMESIIISREYDQRKCRFFSPRTKESSQWNRYLFAESTDRTIDS